MAVCRVSTPMGRPGHEPEAQGKTPTGLGHLAHGVSSKPMNNPPLSQEQIVEIMLQNQYCKKPWFRGTHAKIDRMGPAVHLKVSNIEAAKEAKVPESVEGVRVVLWKA